MADESDGIEEAVESTVRLSAMAAARVGIEIARAHEDRLHEQRRVDEQEADRLHLRLEAERQIPLAPGQMPSRHPRDWTDARPDSTLTELGRAEEWAKSSAPDVWKDYQNDLMGADTGDGIRSAEGDLLRSWRDAQTRNPDPEEGRDDDRRRFEEDAVAALLLAEADSEAEVRYDSAERRTADARAMEAHGVELAIVESRMRADTGRAQPATQATAGTRGGRLAPKARKNRGSQLELPGIER